MDAGVNKRHRVAQAMAALCVGGMVVARAMDDRVAADGLRDACMAVALRLGGWENTKAARNGRRKVTANAKTMKNGKRH
jgi:hypothetical protein